MVPASSFLAPSAHWRPDLPCASHSEIFAEANHGAGAAAALALALAGGCGREGHLLWVQDRASLRLNGRPYAPGLPAAWRGRLIHALAERAEDALFALEEGLRCRDLACVIGELAGNPRALDFTASRRLSLAAERYGVPLFLVRLGAAPDLGSARMRWRIGSAPSLAPRWDAAAPGAPAWHAELFRARAHPVGHWILRDDGTVLAADPTAPPDHGDLAGADGDRSLAAR